MNAVVQLVSDQVTNGGDGDIAHGQPYHVSCAIKGVVPIIFHRWNCDAVEEKARAKKGSKAKKEDNIESYVYRNDAGDICVPGEYFRGAIVNAAKFQQDPRSPRKSAMDLVKAGCICTTTLASLGKGTWDFLDRRRAVVQRSAITRIRPAMREGWKVTFDLAVVLPQYISPDFLRQIVDDAGKLVGIADMRPTYGRFNVDMWSVGLSA